MPLALVAATPNRLRYKLTAAGGGGESAARTRTQMLADLPAGSPLRAVLQKAATVLAWEALPDNIRIAIRPVVISAANVTVRVLFTDAGDLLVSFNTDGASTVLFDIEYAHSLVR